MIVLALTSNALDPGAVYQTADSVMSEKLSQLPGLARWMPPSVKTHVVFDLTTLIRASIADVQLTVAVGFIVDDAVIVVENVVRRIDAGEAPAAAALGSARQMGFTVIAITAALVAALLPVLFMPDVIGRCFSEFGVTLAAAILFSAAVSLTLTPMLCSRLLGPASPHAARRSRLTRFYRRSLRWSLTHPAPVVLAVLLVTGGGDRIHG